LLKKPKTLCSLVLSEKRLNRIYRDCDQIYQKLFSYEGLPIKDGCHEFDTVVNGISEKGVHCACRTGDNCNIGNITWPEV
jgi:hypothetical protein